MSTQYEPIKKFEAGSVQPTLYVVSATDFYRVAAEQDRLQVLASEMIDLCALGDIDETTDAYGWGDVIKDVKCAIAGKQADHVATANERLRALNNTLLSALETAKRIGHLTYVKRGAAFSAAFVAGCDEVDAAIALAREG